MEGISAIYLYRGNCIIHVIASHACSTINRENMNPSYVQKQQQPSNTGMQRNSNFTPYPCNQGKNLTSKSWHHERSTPQHPSARGHVKNTAETGPNVHSGRQFAAADQSVTAVGNSSITAVGNTTAQAHEPTEVRCITIKLIDFSEFLL